MADVQVIQTLETMRNLFSVDLIRMILAGSLGAFLGELNRNYSKFSINGFIISFLSSAFMAAIAGILIKESFKLKSPAIEAVTALMGWWGHKKTIKFIETKK